MAVLSVDLQDGFVNDTVVVLVDGQEVFRRAGVRTRRMLGYADSMQTPISRRPVTLEVRLPLKNLTGTTVLDPEKTPYVGVSVTGSEVRCILSRAPFGYA